MPHSHEEKTDYPERPGCLQRPAIPARGGYGARLQAPSFQPRRDSAPCDQLTGGLANPKETDVDAVLINDANAINE
jgi:hypothetical protein